jgi:molecular chaperone DnaJ
VSQPLDEVFAQFENLFGEFFGGRPASRDAGADLRVTLQLTAGEALVGCRRDIEVTRARVCAECAGAGGFGEASVCKDSAGAGKRMVQQGFFLAETLCATCCGTAKWWSKPCGACALGLVRRAEKLAIVVPPGTEHGQMLRLKSHGDELAGKPSGDLYVAIEIEGHAAAESAPELGKPRDRGHDVVVDAAVRVRHRLFGGMLEVPTPDGSATVNVPRGVHDGHEIRLVGRGKPRATRAPDGAARDPYRDVERGELVVVLRVPPAVQKRHDTIRFAALIGIVIALVVALSVR